ASRGGECECDPAHPHVPSRVDRALSVRDGQRSHHRALDHPHQRAGAAAVTRIRTIRGFTLVEMLVALTLLALMAGVLFGSLQLAGRSWEGGEAKAASVDAMRQTQMFLRGQLAGALPKRMPKAVDRP